MSKQSAKIVAHSKCAVTGQEIITWEIEYWRPVLAELNKHRVFSKNDQSSRAVPLDQAIKRCWNDPFYPIYWGSKKSGMSAGKELKGLKKSIAKVSWWAASKAACVAAWCMDKVGFHKQHAARVLEPFLTMKGVLTTTEIDNFFWLRIDAEAQPEIDELARLMKSCLNESVPYSLLSGDWHMPYYRNGIWTPEHSTPLQKAIEISASSCAQVSFRKLDQSLEKIERVWSRLVEGDKLHAVCLEHPATPLLSAGQLGYTHTDLSNNLWSGNFNGWVQYRKVFEQKDTHVN